VLKTIHILISFLFLQVSLVQGENLEINKTKTPEGDFSSVSPSKIAFQIPIRDQIGAPILDILRRGLKDAISKDADIVIIDMDTPGGELGVTFGNYAGNH